MLQSEYFCKHSASIKPRMNPFNSICLHPAIAKCCHLSPFTGEVADASQEELAAAKARAGAAAEDVAAAAAVERTTREKEAVALGAASARNG